MFNECDYFWPQKIEIFINNLKKKRLNERYV